LLPKNIKIRICKTIILPGSVWMWNSVSDIKGWILEREDAVVWIGSIWLRIWISGGLLWTW
jgi:hypothetical protein